MIRWPPERLMIVLEKARAKPVRLIEATMRPEAASTVATITPERIASPIVSKIRLGVMGCSPANQETTTAESRL